MPWHPGHPCAKPGCPNIAPYKQKYCEQHKHLLKTDYPRRHPELSKFYTSHQWRKVRRMFLAANPVCSVEGCGKLAEVVHHKQDLKGAWDLRFAWDNLEQMCKFHHDSLRAFNNQAKPRRPKFDPDRMFPE